MKRILQMYSAAVLLFASLGASAANLPDFTGLVKRFSPAVVNISTTSTRTIGAQVHGFNMPDLPENSPLRDLFRRFFGENGGGTQDEEIQSRSLGSGFFISSDGYILTNYHVVAGADKILVRTNDGPNFPARDFPAKVIGSDRHSDIALVKIDVKNAPVAEIGSAKGLQVGEWVLAIGSPFGFDHSVTAGIVSAKGRSLPSENYVPFIQTDVAINPGNSGGPLIDMEGKVVGVNSQIYSRTGGFMGLSFAIPIDLAMNVAKQLRTQGHVSRGWLGVMIQNVTRDLAQTFNMPQARGALVAQVLPGSPAEKAGVHVGDVILAFNGHKLHTSAELPPLVGTSPVDHPSELEILRDGKQMTLKVIIGQLPEEENVAGDEAPHPLNATDRLGLTVRDLTADERGQVQLPKDSGVLVEKLAPGPGKEAGLQPDDIILMMDNKAVTGAEQFRDLVQGLPAGRSVAVLVQRGNGRLFLALHVPK